MVCSVDGTDGPFAIGPGAVGYLTESMHGAGSPQAMRVMLLRETNLEHKKKLARKLAKIDQ
jgi:4-hydroxybutyryl-CoA dehydratase/vinylacetyl-CoA-Delta-isomerase